LRSCVTIFTLIRFCTLAALQKQKTRAAKAISTCIYAGFMTILEVSNSFEFGQKNSR